MFALPLPSGYIYFDTLGVDSLASIGKGFVTISLRLRCRLIVF